MPSQLNCHSCILLSCQEDAELLPSATFAGPSADVQNAACSTSLKKTQPFHLPHLPISIGSATTFSSYPENSISMSSSQKFAGHRHQAHRRNKCPPGRDRMPQPFFLEHTRNRSAPHRHFAVPHTAAAVWGTAILYNIAKHEKGINSVSLK